MATIDQQRLRTIVEINEDDSYTTNSSYNSSSCFISPSSNNSPPTIRRLQALTLAPRNQYDLWSPGIYSFDTNDPSNLTQKQLVVSSDSGRDSADSSFSSENELSPPIKRYTTRALTIYQIEKAKQQQLIGEFLPKKSAEKTRCTFTSSTKVFIEEDQHNKVERPKESEPSTTVLKIYIPPVSLIFTLFKHYCL